LPILDELPPYRALFVNENIPFRDEAPEKYSCGLARKGIGPPVRNRPLTRDLGRESIRAETVVASAPRERIDEVRCQMEAQRGRRARPQQGKPAGAAVAELYWRIRKGEPEVYKRLSELLITMQGLLLELCSAGQARPGWVGMDP
jgi:hypothetical protein